MDKKIGDFCVDGKDVTPVWASIYTYEGITYMSMFFTRGSSPRYDEWYKSLEPLGFKLITKGGFRYGYYYKVIISKKIDNMQDTIDKLKEWKESNRSFNFKYSVEEMYNKFVLAKL